MGNKFIETLALFSENTEDEKLSNDRWCEYIFVLDNVQAYHKSSIGYTVIEFNNGCRYEIAIKFEDFKKIMKDNYNHISKVDSKALYEFNER